MLPTASALDRAMRCPASVVLPVVQCEKPSAAAKRGTILHAWIEARMTGAELPDVGRHKIVVDVDALAAKLAAYDVLRFEHAYSLDEQGRAECLGRMARDYPRRDGVLYGTADVDGENTLSGAGLVLDIKTGRNAVVAPADNAQLRFLATAAAIARPHLTAMHGSIAYLNRDGSWRFVDCEWPIAWLREQHRIELDWWRATWREAVELHAAGWPVEPSPSVEACRYCRCECSAKINPYVRGADAPPLTDADAV